MKNPLDNPAFYSAIAAFFSALAAWTMVLIQRRNAIDSVKPELVLLGWSRKQRESGLEVIHVSFVKNVGKGSALHAGFFTPDHDPMRVGFNTQRTSIIPPGEQIKIDMELVPIWQHAADAGNSGKIHSFELGIAFSDTRDYRHKTIYHITLFSDPNAIVGGAEELGPRIYGYRRSTAEPIWKLKLKARFSRGHEKATKLWRKARRQS